MPYLNNKNTMTARYILIVIPTALIFSITSCKSQNKKSENTIKVDTTVETNKNMNGQVIMTTTFVNGIEHGPYKMYYDDGTLEAEGNNVNGKIFGEVKSYTPAGKLAKIEVWDTTANPYMDNEMMSSLVDEIVFWEEVPAEYDKFLFVSDSGYYRVKGGVFNTDAIKPDNIIETKSDDKGTDVFIWKNGKKELYKRVNK